MFFFSIFEVGMRCGARRRRLEAFTTDAKIIRLTRQRVAFFGGDCDGADSGHFPGVYLRSADLGLCGLLEKGGKSPHRNKKSELMLMRRATASV